MEKNLNDFVKDNSKFLRLSDKESFEGTYKGFKVTQSTFDPEKETVVYRLAYSDGKQVFFQTASVAVAKTFGKLKGGEQIRIIRHGAGTKTQYAITSPDIHIDDSELEPDQDFNPDVI